MSKFEFEILILIVARALLWLVCLGTMLLVLVLARPAHADASEIRQIHRELLRHFTPTEETDEWPTESYSGHEPFSGNCKDFFVAAFNRLMEAGYVPFAVTGWDRGTGHIVACTSVGKRTYCLDNLSSIPVSITRLRRTYSGVKVWDLEKHIPQ